MPPSPTPHIPASEENLARAIRLPWMDHGPPSLDGPSIRWYNYRALVSVVSGQEQELGAEGKPPLCQALYRGRYNTRDIQHMAVQCKGGVQYMTNTVSFHNFKSQNSKLRVSNPKSKYVAYLSVLSRISNCQSLGRKNKHETLKTDRTDFRVSIR